MENKNKETDKRNAKTYTDYRFRVRKDSELAKLLEDHLENGEVSLNFLISELLCKHFECKLPHREYRRTIRERII